MFPRVTVLSSSTPLSSHPVHYSGQRPEDVHVLCQHNSRNSTVEEKKTQKSYGETMSASLNIL